MRERRQSLGTAFSELFSTTGRALTFDLAAVLLGFGVLLLSDVPPLVRFGVLIAASVITSFIATVLLLPALVCLTRPRFLQGEQQPHTDRAEVMAGGIGPR
jgi:predicted RND superfamily exporter protein